MNDNTLLDRMRFAPEKQKVENLMETFGLEPILAHFEQEGGVKSVRDGVLGRHLKLTRPYGGNGMTVANKLCSIDLFCGIGGFRLASALSPSTLACPLTSATLPRSELGREHSTLAGDDRRGARTHPLGTHSAAGRVVHGIRTRTR